MQVAGGACSVLALNLPPTATEETLLTLFSNFSIVSVRFHSSNPSAAILTFESQADRDEVLQFYSSFPFGTTTCYLTDSMFETPLPAKTERPYPHLILDPDFNKPSPSEVRFVCMADTHGYHDYLLHPVPPGDVLLFAGDFTLHGKEEEVHKFVTFLDSLQFKTKIVICGNHEIGFDPRIRRTRKRNAGYDADELAKHLKYIIKQHAYYLEDKLLEVEGYTIYGSPWTAGRSDYAFHLPPGEAMKQKWSEIPPLADIILTHAPPLSKLDDPNNPLYLTPITESHAGDSYLKQTIERVKPLVHVCGHIHERYGAWKEGPVLYINAAISDEARRPIHAPISFDLPRKGTIAWQNLKAKRLTQL